MLTLDQPTGRWKINKIGNKNESNIEGSECSKFMSLLKSNPEDRSSHSTCFHTAYSLFLAHTLSYNCTHSAV